MADGQRAGVLTRPPPPPGARSKTWFAERRMADGQRAGVLTRPPTPGARSKTWFAERRMADGQRAGAIHPAAAGAAARGAVRDLV